MTRRARIERLLLGGLFALSLALPACKPEAEEPAPETIPPGASVWSIHFFENQGQVDPSVDYYLHGDNASLFFRTGGVRFALREAPFEGFVPDEAQRVVFDLEFVDATPGVAPIGEAPGKAVVHHLIGPEEGWLTGIPTFGRVVYPGLWPGIDLVYEADVNSVKYSFEVAPGADPSLIQLRYVGVEGGAILGDGSLQVDTLLDPFVDAAPLAYQEDGAGTTDVPVSFHELDGAGRDFVVGFQVGAYDLAKPLVIDPEILVYSGFLGGGDYDVAYGVDVDAAGRAFVVGATRSADFPSVTGLDTTIADKDGFLARIAADGATLQFVTYFGGSKSDTIWDVCLDMHGRPNVTGSTKSPDFPTVDAYDSTCGNDGNCNGAGGTDAFVSKIDPTGTYLWYSTFLGGSNSGGPELGESIACESWQDVYVTGTTTALDFPTKNAMQTANAGLDDAFVAHLKTHSSGNASLVYSTFLGGAGYDAGKGIAVHQGEPVVVGFAGNASSNFPTVNAEMTDQPGTDAFVTKLDASGTILFSTYWGGIGTHGELAEDVTVDADGNIYVTGTTNSSNFPTHVNAFDKTLGPSAKAFVSKFLPTGQNVYSSYLGGNKGYTHATGIEVDGDKGYVYVTGHTGASDFPVAYGLDEECGSDGFCDPDTQNFPTEDAFLAQIDNWFTSVRLATYLGGGGSDVAYALAQVKDGVVTLVGGTDSADYPEDDSPWSAGYAGGQRDGFVTSIDWSADIEGSATTSEPIVHFDSGVDPHFVVSAENHGPMFANVRIDAVVEAGIGFTVNASVLTPTPGSCTVTGAEVECTFWHVDAGQTASVRLDVALASPPIGPETMMVQVDTLGSEADPVPGNNSASAQVQIQP